MLLEILYLLWRAPFSPHLWVILFKEIFRGLEWGFSAPDFVYCFEFGVECGWGTSCLAVFWFGLVFGEIVFGWKIFVVSYFLLPNLWNIIAFPRIPLNITILIILKKIICLTRITTLKNTLSLLLTTPTWTTWTTWRGFKFNDLAGDTAHLFCKEFLLLRFC